MNAVFNAALFVEAAASLRNNHPAAVAVAAAGAAQAAPIRLRRERDFGVGYGNSSGYGLERRYTSNGFAPRFRCA